jgi:molecular chaperone GrpE (heat shock protein)
MNDNPLPAYDPEALERERSGPLSPAEHTIGSSTIYRLCEEVIALREKNDRQHRMFEQELKKANAAMQGSFNSFAADTQRAYQQLRQEIQGEKRTSLALLNELLEISLDLKHIVASRPASGDGEGLDRWAEAVGVEMRKVQAALERHGVQRFDAVIGSPYNPAIHERVGSRRVDGMDALRVALQVEHGLASQQPDFVLRRPKVVITE